MEVSVAHTDENHTGLTENDKGSEIPWPLLAGLSTVVLCFGTVLIYVAASMEPVAATAHRTSFAAGLLRTSGYFFAYGGGLITGALAIYGILRRFGVSLPPIGFFYRE